MYSDVNCFFRTTRNIRVIIEVVIVFYKLLQWSFYIYKIMRDRSDLSDGPGAFL